MSNLDLAFVALADPTRRRIVARLTRGEIRVTYLAQPFAMSLNAVSKHVKMLERAGLVRRTRVGREHWLHLRAQPLREVQRWTSQYERFWNRRLDALADFLDEQKESEHEGSQ
ncbi:MAG: winged helix-turn-helix transcriptional regulator [Proteobacteria bacterium]|nr:winged helix-turn-helix transcriptional regulator [Pseudomonadota bacterium]